MLLLSHVNLAQAETPLAVAQQAVVEAETAEARAQAAYNASGIPKTTETIAALGHARIRAGYARLRVALIREQIAITAPGAPDAAREATEEAARVLDRATGIQQDVVAHEWGISSRATMTNNDALTAVRDAGLADVQVVGTGIHPLALAQTAALAARRDLATAAAAIAVTGQVVTEASAAARLDIRDAASATMLATDQAIIAARPAVSESAITAATTVAAPGPALPLAIPVADAPVVAAPVEAAPVVVAPAAAIPVAPAAAIPVAPPATSIDGYQWDGSPQVFRTSQISEGAIRRSCGNENFEVCIGPASNATGSPPSPPQLVKCFIAKNTTECPTVISAARNCFVASAPPPGAMSSRPVCDRRPSANDNLPGGCSCEKYGRSQDMRRTAAICGSEKRARDLVREYRAACGENVARAAGNLCDDFCNKPNNSANLRSRPKCAALPLVAAAVPAVAAPAVAAAVNPSLSNACETVIIIDINQCSFIDNNALLAVCPATRVQRTCRPN